MARRPPSAVPGLPSEAQILEFIQSQKGKVGKREIARAFGISGSARLLLKRLLKDMEERGTIGKKSRKFNDLTRLPPVGVIEVTGVDGDGEAIAEPVDWEGDGAAPIILVRENQQPPGKGDRLLAKLQKLPDGPYAYEARVIRRLGRQGARHLGVFRAIKGGYRIVPVDKKAKGELQVLPANTGGALNGELVEAEIVRDRGRGLLHAKVRERLGDVNDQRNVSRIAILTHGIPVDFPENVVEQARILRGFSRSGRLDLRDMPLITIDPPDARDHDDAVWAAPDDDPANPGGFKVVVAIADVAHYIRPETLLDREARIRGNSVYFPDRVVPMLPERISNDLCSLREGEDRPALACLMSFDKSGTKRNHRFERVVMRSAAKLSYEQAQAAIDGNPDFRTDVLIETVLRPLWQAYGALMKARQKRGPLELDIPERKLILDAHGLIERVVTPLRLDAHKLIEEFMIQANVAAAETLEALRTPLLYRVHDRPSKERVAALAEFLETLNLTFPKGQTIKPQQFNRVLGLVKGKDYEHLVNQVVLRSQAQAIYNPENIGHFGLNLRRYAHFTSPIRRYADLIVHRALIAALKLGMGGLSDSDVAMLKDTAEIISATERRAMAAERETVDRLIASHLASRTGTRFHGRIGGVVGAGLFVTLADSGADGFVPVSTLGGEYFVFDEARHALIGEKTGRIYQLGDPVEVLLVEVAPVAGGLRFEMLSPGRKEKPPARGAATQRRRLPGRSRHH